VEFLRCVLDRLHDELPYQQPIPGKVSRNEGIFCMYMNPSKSNSIISSEDSHVNDAVSSASSTTTRTSIDRVQKCQSTHASVISNIFQGLLESRIKCLHCQKVIYDLILKT